MFKCLDAAMSPLCRHAVKTAEGNLVAPKAGATLVAFRLPGPSALDAHYAGVKAGPMRRRGEKVSDPTSDEEPPNPASSPGSTDEKDQ
jgi:hypothetical protein